DALLVNVGDAAFFGEIYAPTAKIDFVDNTLIHGAVLGYGLSGVGNLVVESGTPIETPKETCRKPQEPRGSSGGGGESGAATGTGGADPSGTGGAANAGGSDTGGSEAGGKSVASSCN